MKKFSFALAAIGLVVCSSSAFALNLGGTDNSVNNTANGGAGGSVLGSGNSNATATGGMGGSVMGSGNSAATGGSVLGSGNSANQNTNLNGNVNTNLNGVSGVNRSSNTNNVSSNSNSAASSNNNNEITIQGDTYEAQKRNPVSTAYAAPLSAANGTCMGSTSVGAQGVAFGLSVGSTWKDESCDMRYDAEALRAAGLNLAAQARLCQKPEIAKAMEAAGTPCPGSASKAAATPAPAAPAAAKVASNQVDLTPGSTYTGNDPIIRARLGLPPLK